MHSRTRLGAVSSVLIALLVTTGCFERRTAPLRPRLGFAQDVRISDNSFGTVDLLLVVDDSGSMREEQANLAEEIPSLVRDLTSPPDLDGDGRPDWSPVERLRIAIVNTDMGTSGATPPSSIAGSCSGLGADGAHLTSAGCAGAEGRTLHTFVAGEDDPDAFATRIGCIVESLGIMGCGIEQQLEAGARGVERGLPLGFPADDALLAVLVLTDEEDCSLAEPAPFYAAFSLEIGNVLCQRAAQGIDGARPEWLRPIDDLAARISAGRDERSFVFSAITGIPIALSGGTAADILAHPDMRYREITTTRGLESEPVCTGLRADGTSLGSATPARRIVELSTRFESASLHSICTDDFRPAVRDLARKIGGRIGGVCLTRAIPMTGDRVDCEVKVTLPPGEACDGARGQRLHERDEEGRAVCVIDQVPGGEGGEGFFYDVSDPACAKLTFTGAAVPSRGSDVRVSCYFEVPQPDAPPAIVEDGGTPTGP